MVSLVIRGTDGQTGFPGADHMPNQGDLLYKKYAVLWDNPYTFNKRNFKDLQQISSAMCRCPLFDQYQTSAAALHPARSGVFSPSHRFPDFVLSCFCRSFETRADPRPGQPFSLLEP